jgi:carboxylesterase
MSSPTISRWPSAMERRPVVVESAHDAVPVAPLLDLTGPLDELVEALPKITSPSLLFVSPQDHVVDPASTELWGRRVSGPVETISLLDSFHVATLDHDAELINLESVRFALRSVER